MTELEAVNTVLRYLGEYPVESVDVMYPTVAMIKPALDEQVEALLIQGWWFNTNWQRVLEQDALGQVPVPTGTLLVIPKEDRYIWNGTYICKSDGTAPNQNIVADLIVDMPFESLPVTAQRLVVYSAAYTVYVADFGVDNTAQTLQQQAGGYYQTLTAQHVRTRKYSTKDRSYYRNYVRALRQ